MGMNFDYGTLGARSAYATGFKGNAQQTSQAESAPIFEDVSDYELLQLSTKQKEQEEKKAKRNKAIAIAAALAAVAVTGYAYFKGKKINNGAGGFKNIFKNIGTGFKNFFKQVDKNGNITEGMVKKAKEATVEAQDAVNKLQSQVDDLGKQIADPANAAKKADLTKELEELNAKLMEAKTAAVRANSTAATTLTRQTLQGDEAYQRAIETAQNSKAKLAEANSKVASLKNDLGNLGTESTTLAREIDEIMKGPGEQIAKEAAVASKKARVDEIANLLAEKNKTLATLEGNASVEGSIAQLKEAYKNAGKTVRETYTQMRTENLANIQKGTATELLESFKKATEGRALTQAEKDLQKILEGGGVKADEVLKQFEKSVAGKTLDAAETKTLAYLRAQAGQKFNEAEKAAARALKNVKA